MIALPERRFRVAVSSYVVLGGIFGAMFAFTMYATFFTHPSFWKAAASAGVVLIFVLIWLAAFEIRISDDELRLRSLFGGVKRISHDDIRNVRLGFDLRSNGGPLRLFIEPKINNIPTISINAKVFSREAIRAVLDLGARVATVDAGGLEDGVVARAGRTGRSKKAERDAR